MPRKTRKWLSIGPDSVTVKLSRPSVMNGVKQNKVVLRVPTVGDLRAASKQAKDDREEQEVILFASLAECGVADIEKLSVVDYNRVQEGYFRLIDDSDDDGVEAAGTAAGG